MSAAAFSTSSSPFLSRRTVAAGLIMAATLLAYLNSWNAPFVYDDTLAISQNPTIRKLWPLHEVLLPQAHGGLTVSGRPVLNLSFALNFAVSGTDPWSYHVFNVLIHTVSALLLFGLVRRTLARRAAGSVMGAFRSWNEESSSMLAVVIAAIWAVQPLQTQAVTYTVQRAESLMGCFFLLTLYAFARAVDSAREGARPKSVARWYGLCVGACVLGMGTKEVMATAPLLVLLYDRTFVAGSFAGAWRTRRGFYFALAATWLVLAALVWSTGGNRGGTVGLGVGVPLWAYPLTQFQAVARYLVLAVWPSPLVFEYGTFWVERAADILPYAIVVLPLLGGTLFALWRYPAVGFLGAWFFLILAPTSLAPGTIQMIVEHRPYLSLAAVITLLVVGLHRFGGRRALVACGAAALSFAVLTANRNRDYRSHLALWSDTVAKRPLNPRAHEGLAEALAAAGDVAEAARHRAEAVRLLPDESTYHYNLALTLTDLGRDEDAIRHYRLALRLHATEARTHNNLAILLAKRGDFPSALSHYAEAVRLKPEEPLYHYNLGTTLTRLDRHAEAAKSYEDALRLRPDYPDAHFNLGTALLRTQRVSDALRHYAAAVRLVPGDAAYGSALGGALLLAGQADEALTAFERVLSSHPEHLDARFGAGNALSALRRYDAAIAHYEAVLRRKPDHANAHFKLGNALLDLDRVADAIPHYEAALRFSPTDAEAHHNLGIAFARLERWSDAQRAFEAALRLKPDYADARRSLEQLRAVIGR